MRYVKWDVQAAREKAAKGSFAAKAVRKEVYDNNCEIFAAGGYVSSAGKEVKLAADERDAMLSDTVVYAEPFSVADVPMLDKAPRKEVRNEECLVMAKRLKDTGYNPAVLNLADLAIACGFYEKGSNAQEESLCRQTTLSQNLYQWFEPRRAAAVSVPFRGAGYPMDESFGGIYSPVKVIRSGAASGFALLDDPWEVGIISVAGLDFGRKQGRDLHYATANHGYTDAGREVMRQKIRTIYRIALHHGHDALVLGALGCGAFDNRPEAVAFLFRQVLTEEEFRKKFRFVGFAILEGKGKATGPNGKFASFYQLFQ